MFSANYDFRLFETGPLPEKEFAEAGKLGKLNELLARYPLKGEWHTKNMMFDHVVANIFERLFGGGGAPTGWNMGDAGALLGFVNMGGSGASSEPSYQEATTYTSYGQNIHSVSYSVDTSGGSKRFIEDQIETHWCAKDPNGRESVFFRNRWLWLPTQAVGNIYSAQVYCNYDGDSTTLSGWAQPFGQSARVRLKDSAGNPIIINKLSTQALLIDYALTLYSV